jgi:hypothetical protein
MTCPWSIKEKSAMHTTTYRKTSLQPRLRKMGLALFLSSACGLFASSANAQWAVYDATTNSTAYTGLLNNLQQLQTEYAQLVSSINGLSTGLSLVPNQLQQISDPSSLIQANCQSSSGSGIAGIAMNALSSLNSQSITATQQQICATIVTTEVDKYNKTVAVLNDMGQYNTMFQQVQQVNQAVQTLADNGRANNQTQVYSSAVTTEMSNWHAQMEADDAIISTLQQQQDMLSRVSLNGGGGGMLSTSLPDTSFQSVIGNIQ